MESSHASLDRLTALEQEALASLQAASTSDALQAWNGKYFGTKRNKGALDEIMSELGKLSKEERPAFGKRANEGITALRIPARHSP